jgi:NADPH:quinone reductase-like Zn-dependent oxidoreductase
VDYKSKLTQEFFSRVQEKLKNGTMKPVISKTFSWKNVKDAHQFMEDNSNAGKIVLKID